MKQDEVRAVMKWLGAKKSEAKAKAARENGAKGGRPPRWPCPECGRAAVILCGPTCQDKSHRHAFGLFECKNGHRFEGGAIKR